MIYTNQEELDAALAEWQKTLRLQDWDIKASIVREKNLMMNDVVAAVRWGFTSKGAVVQLIDPIDYSDNPDEELDHEISLVHELLHLHYAGFDKTEKGSTEERLLEQSIEAISRSLVKLKRAEVQTTGTGPQLPRGLPLEASNIVAGSTWRNNKIGALYTVKGWGRHSETLEQEVEYVDSVGDCWHRPVHLFLEKFTRVAKEVSASETKG